MLTIRKGGMQTTVQDLGRFGFQQYGVVAAGAMDTYAFRMANLVVGNDENAAALEVALKGPEIIFEEDAIISICGSDFSPKLDHKAIGLWRIVNVSEGQTLTFGEPRGGSRCYLAIAGGIDVLEIMNSRSTYLRAKLGGFQGRALAAGDRLSIGTPVDGKEYSVQNASWSVPVPPYSSEPVIRVTPGRQYKMFSKESQEHFFSQSFSISSQSDRMGYRLEGPKLALTEKQEMISEAVAFGSIQVPSDGNPIVLMADRQTAGGYPKIAEVITVDLPLISQLKPGSLLRFKEVSIEEAQRLLRLQEKKIHCLKRAIKLKREEM